MKSRTFHRPPAPPVSPLATPTTARATGHTSRHQPPARRWTFHDAAEAAGAPPTGHGWHSDGPDIRRDGKRRTAGERWTCDYGCKSFVAVEVPSPGWYHAYDCPYWWNEGIDETPF